VRVLVAGDSHDIVGVPRAPLNYLLRRLAVTLTCASPSREPVTGKCVDVAGTFAPVTEWVGVSSLADAHVSRNAQDVTGR
jgi:hypothetical protein